MKTAVSIPDSVFAAADQLARRRRMSRSALYTEALRLILATADDQDLVTKRLDEIYTRLDSTLDPELLAAQTAAIDERW